MQFNSINYIGALTSKPYAFLARSWELKVFESIDIFDNLGSNIRIDLRNFEILRILPKFNSELNQDWISDKVRFCYDGLYKQRLNVPLVRQQGGTLLPTSWKKAFFFLKNSTFKDSTVDSFVGDLVDFETLLIFKEFLNTFGACTFNLKNYLSLPSSICNLRSLYITNLKHFQVAQLKNFIIFGLQLQVENPILNLSVRAAVIKASLRVINFGFFYGTIYPSVSLGTHYLNSLKFLEGSLQFLGPRLLGGSSYFLLGSNLFYKQAGASFLHFIDFLNVNIFKKSIKCNYSIFFTGSNTASIFELGGNPSLNFNTNLKTSHNWLYLLDADDINFNIDSYENRIIYQGHHGDFLVHRASLVLPSFSLYEKQSHFINLYGFIQFIDNILLPLNFTDVKQDWEVIKGLSDFLGYKLPYNSFKLLLKSVKKIIPKKYLTFSKFNSLFYIPFLVFSNKPLLNFVGNYFLTNSITRASLVMTLCAFRFKITTFN